MFSGGPPPSPVVPPSPGSGPAPKPPVAPMPGGGPGPFPPGGGAPMPGGGPGPFPPGGFVPVPGSGPGPFPPGGGAPMPGGGPGPFPPGGFVPVPGSRPGPFLPGGGAPMPGSFPGLSAVEYYFLDSDLSVKEGDYGTVRIGVQKIGGGAPDHSRPYAAIVLASHISTSNGDFDLGSGNPGGTGLWVNFSPGANEAQLRIPIRSDTFKELDELFSVKIVGGNDSSDKAGTRDSVRVTIPASEAPALSGTAKSDLNKLLSKLPPGTELSGWSPPGAFAPNFGDDWPGYPSYIIGPFGGPLPKSDLLKVATTLGLIKDGSSETKAPPVFIPGKGEVPKELKPEAPKDLLAKMTASDWEMYVDRYPNTLGVIYQNLIKASGQSKAAFGEKHYLENGFAEGRLLKVAGKGDDLNDYGAYVENYGATLLDVYRSGVGPSSSSLFAWGKWHYETFGKGEGRDVNGGVDWGAIVKNDSKLLSQFTDAQRSDPTLTAFKWGNLNQSVIATTIGKELSTGSPLSDTLQGTRLFGQAGDDILIGTTDADIINGGFGNDIIIGIEQAKAVKDVLSIPATASSSTVPSRYKRDYVYGGPGDDQFILSPGAWLLVQDFRKGSDVVRLGNLQKDQILLEENLTMSLPSTDFVEKSTGQTLATVFGQRAGDFTYALVSRGLANVFV